MDLRDALRTTGAVREFRDEPVPPEVLAGVLDTARFAPSGGNQQAWRVVVVEDSGRRASIAELYRRGWHEYLTLTAAGLRPWAPVTDRQREEEVLREAAATFASRTPTNDFAEHVDRVPVMLVVVVDLAALAAVDRDLDRYTFVGGASVYPFVWSVLLAAHGAGLGGVMTTMPIRREAELLRVLGAPDGWAAAALVALGWPARRPTRLRRNPVDSFTTVDRFDGPPLTPAPPS